VIDPAGVGFYGQFLPSAYCGGFVLNMVFETLARAPLTQPGDLDRHLALLVDLARMVDQMAERTRGQAERGMRMPKPPIPAARALVTAFAERAAGLAEVGDERFSDTTRPLAAVCRAEPQRRVGARLQPSFTALAAVFDAAFEAAAPDGVGLSQFDRTNGCTAPRTRRAPTRRQTCATTSRCSTTGVAATPRWATARRHSSWRTGSASMSISDPRRHETGPLEGEIRWAPRNATFVSGVWTPILTHRDEWSRRSMKAHGRLDTGIPVA
jgi:hypothetical protein